MIKIEKGLVFTGMYGAFDGRIEVLEVNEEKNEIKVSLTKRIGDLDKFSKWEENWELKNTQLGFEIGDYLKCNPVSFEGYPPLINELGVGSINFN